MVAAFLSSSEHAKDSLVPWTMKLRKLTPEAVMREKASNEAGQRGGKATEKEHVTIK